MTIYIECIKLHSATYESGTHETLGDWWALDAITTLRDSGVQFTLTWGNDGGIEVRPVADEGASELVWDARWELAHGIHAAVMGSDDKGRLWEEARRLAGV